jgi:hypothetical protein
MLSPSERARLKELVETAYVPCNVNHLSAADEDACFEKAWHDFRAAFNPETCRALLADLEAAERERDALREAARWIPVEEKLPEAGQEVMVYALTDDSEGPFQSITLADGGFFEAIENETITHWKPVTAPPLPATPKEQTR